MKTEIEYIAKSKTKSIRFDKHSYILNLREEGKLIKCDVMRYGYLSVIIQIGNKRGWFITEISMFKDDIEQRYDFDKGKIKVEI